MNEPPINVSNDRKPDLVSYEQYGKNCAMDTRVSLENLEGSLATIHQDLLVKNQLTEVDIKKRVKQLEDEILNADQEINQKNSEVEKKNNTIERVKKQIAELNESILNVKDNLPSLNVIPFSISVFLVIVLTLYLFVFYSSAGYSAFYGVKDGTSFIHSGVFRDAKIKGGEVMALFILFPAIFLSLGFLIHDFIDKKKYLQLFALIAFTLIFDAMLAFKIAEGIYNNKLLSGEVTSNWRSEFAFKDVNFWIIIAAGFVVYIIWGLLLHHVMSEYKNSQPGNREKALVEKLKTEIATAEDDIIGFKNEISQFEADIEKLKNEREKKLKDKGNLESGKIHSIITTTKLEAAVGDFMRGWTSFIAFNWSEDIDTQNRLNRESKAISERWTNRIIAESNDVNFN